MYLINNPDYIEKVLIFDHKTFRKGTRLQLAKGLLGEGLVTNVKYSRNMKSDSYGSRTPIKR